MFVYPPPPNLKPAIEWTVWSGFALLMYATADQPDGIDAVRGLAKRRLERDHDEPGPLPADALADRQSQPVVRPR